MVTPFFDPRTCITTLLWSFSAFALVKSFGVKCFRAMFVFITLVILMLIPCCDISSVITQHESGLPVCYQCPLPQMSCPTADPRTFVIPCTGSAQPPATTSATPTTAITATHTQTHTPTALLSLGKWICLMMERVHYLAVQWSACGPSRLAVSSPQNRSGSLLGPGRRMGWSCSLIHHSSAGNKQLWGGFKKKERKKKGNQCKRHNSSHWTRAIPLFTAAVGLTVSFLIT